MLNIRGITIWNFIIQIYFSIAILSHIIGLNFAIGFLWNFREKIEVGSIFVFVSINWRDRL